MEHSSSGTEYLLRIAAAVALNLLWRSFSLVMLSIEIGLREHREHRSLDRIPFRRRHGSTAPLLLRIRHRHHRQSQFQSQHHYYHSHQHHHRQQQHHPERATRRRLNLDFVSLALDCGDGDSSTSTRVFIGGCTFVCVQQYVLYMYAVAYISNLHYQARRKFVGVDGYVPLCLVRRSKNTTTPKGVHVMGFCKLIWLILNKNFIRCGSSVVIIHLRNIYDCYTWAPNLPQFITYGSLFKKSKI